MLYNIRLKANTYQININFVETNTIDMENYLTLKWGTLKSWDFSNSERGKELLKEYHNIGCSFSAMAQRDTNRQKEIICELIDLCDGDTIYLEWDGEDVSKERAKLYVLNYGKDS